MISGQLLQHVLCPETQFRRNNEHKARRTYSQLHRVYYQNIPIKRLYFTQPAKVFLNVTKNNICDVHLNTFLYRTNYRLQFGIGKHP